MSAAQRLAFSTGTELPAEHAGGVGQLLVPPAVAAQAGISVKMPAGTAVEFVLPRPTVGYFTYGAAQTRIDGVPGSSRAGALLLLPAGPRRILTLEESVVRTVGFEDDAFEGRFAVEPRSLVLHRGQRREWDERLEALLAHRTRAAVEEAVRAATAARIEDAAQRAGARLELVNAVLDVLRTTLDRAPTLAELGERFGYAPNHLSDLMAARTGRSIRQWTIAFRLDAARRELERTNRSVTDVAAAFGFESAYFTRRFIARYSVTPSAWRAMLHVQPAGLFSAPAGDRLARHSVSIENYAR